MTVSIAPLTPEFAASYDDEILSLVHEIPNMLAYSNRQELLSEEELPNGKLLNTKWLYSLVALNEEKTIGTAIGYERRSDGTENYPEASVHLDVLAVAPDYRGKGNGGRLLSSFLLGAYAMNHGQYIQMTGLFQFSLTTSATPENQNVRQLYESFGFQPAVYRQIDGLPYVTMRAVGTQVMRAINDYQFSK